jgi:hypothetical protein
MVVVRRAVEVVEIVVVIVRREIPENDRGVMMDP